MAIRPLRFLGDPVLRQKAKRVPGIDDSILELIDDMFETMYDSEGVGLAAPQIGISLRVIVIHVPEGEPFALINPEFVKRSGQRTVVEGCLSVPGYRGEITRSVNVVVKGLSPEGKVVRVRGSNDLLAEALEHEIDHINGTLYIDYLESMDKLQKIEPKEQEEAEGEEEEELATEQ